MYEYAIALTGGIGTGKSSVAAHFSDFGYDIIDADKVAHEILDEQRDTISSVFGQEYINNGRVLRGKLGAMVFDDAEKKKELERLLHPLIRKRIQKMSKLLDLKKITYLIDLPLFYETQGYEISDVIVVYAPKAMQIQRIINRDTYTKSNAEKRINAQIDIEQKKEIATYLVDNSGIKDKLLGECRRIDKYIKRRNDAGSKI